VYKKKVFFSYVGMMKSKTIFYNSQYGNREYVYNIHDYDELIATLAKKTGLPPDAIVLYTRPRKLVGNFVSNPLTLVNNNETLALAGCQLTMRVRPILGDHYHAIVSFWIYLDGAYYFVSPLRDIYPITEYPPNPEEGENTPYWEAIGMNAGFHTHGDGLIHIHPTSVMRPTDFLSEGVNCTMKLFLPVVGIDFRIKNYKSSLMFTQNIHLVPYQETNSASGYTIVDGENYDLLLVSTSTLQWYLFFWRDYSQYLANEKPIIYTNFNDINMMWMYANNAIFYFGYFPIDAVVDDFPTPLRTQIDIVLRGQIQFMETYHPASEQTTANEQTT